MMPRGVYDRSALKAAQPAQTPEAINPAQMPEVPERAQQVAKERRRRSNSDLDGFTTLRLGLTPEVMAENQDFELRWVNDENNRVYKLTQQDDWDVVEGEEPRPVGTAVNGKPVNAVLLRKPKVYAEEDRKAKLDNINQRERQVLRSRDPEAAWKNPDVQGEDAEGRSYVPQGNSIKRAYTP